MRKTKIIATVGPSSVEYNVFEEMVKEGADFIRINTAYSNEKQHEDIVENIEKIDTPKKPEIIFDIRSVEVAEKIIKYNPSIIALSFSESAEAVRLLQERVPDCKVIVKIESEKGVENFDSILDVCWGVMVARGDLGVAVSLEKVPCLQKCFSKKALRKEKYLIIATEMLLSMTKNIQPTRAEVSDVANAVFNRASAVMLSEETAVGNHPVEAVKYMRRIIEQTEECA